MTDILLKIVVSEQHEKQEAACRRILEYLREQDIPGATMKRCEAGLDERSRIRYELLEDHYFNDLPVLIEAAMNQSDLERIKGGLQQMTQHGQISVLSGDGEENRGQHSHYIVKIYTKESTKLIKAGEYEKILQILREHKAIWATVTKAAAGYGSDRMIYGQHIFSASEHLPLVIECIAGREQLPQLLEELKSVIAEGAVFTAPVDLILNK